MKGIREFCDEGTEDNLISLKKRLLGYEQHNNFLSFNYSEAMKFYKLALAQEWDQEGEFKGAEERKVRSRVEARCIEPDALLEHFERLIKGLATSLTAIQTNLRVEEDSPFSEDGMTLSYADIEKKYEGIGVGVKIPTIFKNVHHSGLRGSNKAKRKGTPHFPFRIAPG